MKKILLMEMKNCINRKEFMFISMLLLGISVFSFISECFVYFGLELTRVRSAYDIGMVQGINSLWGILVLLSPLFAIIVYSDSYYSDFQTGVYKNIATRTNVLTYLWGKKIIIFIVTFFVFFIPLLFNQVLAFVAFPIEGYENNYGIPEYAFYMSYDNHVLFDLYRIQNPMLYNFMFILSISLFAALFAILSYSVYFYTNKGKFAVITGFFLVFIAIEIIMSIFGLEKYSLTGCMISGSYGSFTIMLGWICILLFSSLTISNLAINKKELGI